MEAFKSFTHKSFKDFSEKNLKPLADNLKPLAEKSKTALLNGLDKCVAAGYVGLDDSVKMLKFSSSLTHYLMDGNVYPAIDSMVAVNKQLTYSLLSTIKGESDIKDFYNLNKARITSAFRFASLVNTLGKDLFGSAKFPGEKVVARNEFFKLTYIPPKKGVKEQPFTLFHSGGFIPYGDKIFRLVDGFNFYENFHNRGIPVYAMELNGDKDEVKYLRFEIETLVDCIEYFSNAAFAHNNKKKMVFEGYCGMGSQGLAYLAAKPKDAEKKFSAVANFVSPIDGTRCTSISTLLKHTPDSIFNMNMYLYNRISGYVPGDNVRFGLDLTLKSNFQKTLAGNMFTGWLRTDFANVKSLDELSPVQKRDLAGIYWISTHAAKRFPQPVDIMQFSKSLFAKGIARNGDLPYLYKGRKLNLKELADNTTFDYFSFFGGKDPVVLDTTGHCMYAFFGKRYHHTVHHAAGHISYVLSPKMWDTSKPNHMDPNPIDLITQSINKSKTITVNKAEKKTEKKAVTKATAKPAAKTAAKTVNKAPVKPAVKVEAKTAAKEAVKTTVKAVAKIKTETKTKA